MHYVYILSIHIYISRGKPNRSNSKPCPNGILGPSPARMDCMCFATACQNWWCARAFIPCQKRSPLDHLDRLLDMENPAFVGQSSTAPYLPIFLTFSFFFSRSAIYNPSPRCREVVQQITTFDYMDFEAVRKGWFDGSSMDCSWRFSVRNRRKRPGFLRLQRARDSCILADMDECRPMMSGFPQWATTGWMNPCNWSYHFLVLAIAQKVQKTLWALSISPRQPFVPRKRGKATKTCSRRGIRTHLTTLLSPQSRFEAGSLWIALHFPTLPTGIFIVFCTWPAGARLFEYASCDLHPEEYPRDFGLCRLEGWFFFHWRDWVLANSRILTGPHPGFPYGCAVAQDELCNSPQEMLRFLAAYQSCEGFTKKDRLGL